MSSFASSPFDPDVPGPDDDQLTIRTAFADDTFVIALYGELDLTGADEVDRLLRKAEATGAAEVVLDLSGLHFIDSTGVRTVIEADERSRADGNRLSLLRGPDQVQRVFEICGLDDSLPFSD